MKITILYDNEAWDKALTPDWGFACLVETAHGTLLFDTGAKGRILLDNMRKLGLSPSCVDTVFISHGHWDHTGGLVAFLNVRPVRVVLPASYRPPPGATDVLSVSDAVQIGEGLHSTGELAGIEQSLVIEERGRIVVVAGCSHPGVGAILDAAARIGRVSALIGGLHGFEDFPVLASLDRICPAHCTQHMAAIRDRFPDRTLAAGAGQVVHL